MPVETPYNIYFKQGTDYVVMEWDGYATSVQFREGTEYMLSVLKAHKVRKVLADVKDMTIIGQEDQNYVQFNFLPRAIEAGFRAIALVKPTNYFNAVAVESLSYRIKQSVVEMRVFDDIDSAKEWLQGLDFDTL